MTDVLCEYVRRFGVARIIDLTAMDAYRRLIDWERVAETKTDVLHCFDAMAPGDAALTAFGKCVAEELIGLTEDEIADLPSEHRLGTVILRSLGETVAGMPSEDPDPVAPDPAPAIRPADDPTASRPWRFACTKGFHKDVRRRMNEFTRVSQATVTICHDPTPRETKLIKPLAEWPDTWRYRLGDYRIVYRLDKRERRVVFEWFRPRGDVYKGETDGD